MDKRKLAATILAVGVFGLVRSAPAQSPTTGSGQEIMPQPAHEGGLGERLGELGRTIFGGILPIDDKPSKQPTPKKPTHTPATNYADPPRSSSNSSTLAPASGASRSGAAASTERSLRSQPEADQKGFVDTTLEDAADQKPPRQSGTARANATPTSPPSSATVPPALRPLHERLATFRESSFGEAAGTGSTSQAGVGASTASDTPAATRQGQAGGSLPTRTARASAVEPARTQAAVETIRPPEDVPVGRPVISPRGRSSTPVDDLAPSAVRTAQAETRTEAKSAAKPSAGKLPDNLLIARKSPVLSVETVGPRRITVGKESIYEVTIRNSGEIAAEDVLVFVNLPPWAEVSGAEVSTGATQLGAPGDPARPFQWRISLLSAGGKERLGLRIVPRESRPFDLAVRWDCKPAGTQAMIEVQEAKLVMRLDAPREVFYGKKELFTLRISNAGNGDAENVVITLIPVGAGDNRPASHRLGTLAAGEERAVEVELTARQAGELLIQVEARGDGSAHAELAQKVLVRRAALRVDVEGPQMQYVGAPAAYRIRVNNSGNAPARNVRLSLNLPQGGRYLSGVDGSRLQINGTKVQWMLDALSPGLEQSYTVKCSFGTPGVNRVEVGCLGDEDVTAAAATTTQVEAMADLTLEVKDPGRPVPVGEETIYELRVRNRGSRGAEGVEVLAFFSRGVEPVSVEGGLHKMSPGQVVFGPIPPIAPSTDLVLKIHARAEVPGNHIFRAEVHCKPLGTRVVNEQTSYFYQDAPPPQQAARTAPESMAPPQAPQHTADRRELPPAPARTELPAAPRNVPAAAGPGTEPNPPTPPRDAPPVILKR